MRVPGHLRKGFNSLVVLGAWVIWKHRNSCVFNGVPPSVPSILLMAREEALLWTVAKAKALLASGRGSSRGISPDMCGSLVVLIVK
jgi:hypothetical protein